MSITLEDLAEYCTNMLAPEVEPDELQALFADTDVTPEALTASLEGVLTRLENYDLLANVLRAINEDARYAPVFVWLAEVLDDDTVGYLLDNHFWPAKGRGETTFLRILSNNERLRSKDAQTLLEPLGQDVWEDYHLDLALSVIVRAERSEHRAIRKILEAEIRSGRVPVAEADRRALHLLATDPLEHRDPMLKLMGEWRAWAPTNLDNPRDMRLTSASPTASPASQQAPHTRGVNSGRSQ